LLSFWEKNSFLNYDFIIIGAGILGLSTACEIKERNPKRTVLILEKGILPSGASTKNAGFACFGSPTEILSDIKRIGKSDTIDLVRKRFEGINILRKRLGDENIGFLNYGGYELIDNKNLAVLDEINFVNEAVQNIFGENTFELKSERIDEFGFDASNVSELIYSRFESQIDTGLMMASLISYAAALGVRIINGCEAGDIGEKENFVRVTANKNSDKEKIYFDCKTVIICTNAFTNKLFPEFKVTPGRGQVIITKPLQHLKFKGVFHFDEGYYYFRNFENRVIFGGGRNIDFENETTTAFESNEKILDALSDKLSTIILPGQKHEIDYSWSGIMGFNDLKKPEIRKFTDRIIAALSCNGMGIALSSFIAKEITEKIPSI